MSARADVAEAEFFFSGEARVLAFTVRDEDGIPANISGWTLSWTLRVSAESSAIVAKATGNGIAIVNGAAGRADVTISSGDTKGLQGRTYLHEFRRTTVGSESVLAHGILFLHASAPAPA
jgi:hypothetical protein